ncbi:NAD(P)-dependent oxidoreductase [Microbulbifer agarilyticus]|uniref:NAD(P)-dependent oxidoreductase n=1 Tax=Microbulbifer agarilyticus TaxID=260552 RepID=UPI001CD58E72|nr:NAD(P)-dependent oxidoreductase [Microbulbifer agarilyticus]MCA0900699.1 NAD(P)-dependent oxidoreductase [Microbulbifer agarilyticus]
MKTTVAFIGLGVMGYPMAGYLSRAGYQVQIYNRTGSRASQWLEAYQGEAFATPAKAAEGAEIVFACVGNDDDLRQVTVGPDGAFAGMAPGTLFVDHTTASANVARELADKATEHQLGFLDAPVSGGQAGAENGALTIMAGGSEVDFHKAKPLLDCYARAVNLLGPVGSGQLCKMVNQICIAGLVQGLSEGLHFARAAGLDPEQVVEVISKGAAQSWQMENRYQTMLAGDYEHGFAVDWMRKDLAIVQDEARRNGALLPVTALVDQFYSEVQALGGGRWDTSSLFARLENVRKFD